IPGLAPHGLRRRSPPLAPRPRPRRRRPHRGALTLAPGCTIGPEDFSMIPRLVALGLLLSVPAGAAEKIPWTTDRAAAFSRAVGTRAPLLLLFTGPECGERSLPGEPL